MAGGRLTAWFEEQIAEVRAEVAGRERTGHSAGVCNPVGDDAARLVELEKLRDEARRLEGGTATAQGPYGRGTGAGLSNGDGGGGEPACLAKVREALRRDSKPWMRGALREVIDELGGGE